MTEHIVITGRIGTGKTTRSTKLVAQLASDGKTAIRVDYDEVAHQVLDETGIANTPEDRKALGDTLFGDPVALKQHEEMMFPLIFAKVQEIVARASSTGVECVVHEIPLWSKVSAVFSQLFGTPKQVLTLEATDDEIITRLKVSRGLTQAEILLRLEAQR
ncbi:MAG: dephospho-CoA kinase [Candidatus Ancillula sp.]|jgi:dephospho-CoA kinase|nr:dephospho-CoA kinase [Candidatus Ancillula sp.]